MVMYRLARLFLVLLLAGGVVVSAGETALACSCAVGDPASRFAESRRRIRRPVNLVRGAGPQIRKGTSRQPIPLRGCSKSRKPSRVTWRTPLTVMSPWSGASCGFKVRIGERIGVLLREDGGWRSGRCSQLDADVPAAGCGTVAYADLGRSRRGGVRPCPSPVPATSSATTSAPTTTVTVTSTAPAATTTSTAPPPSADPSAALADDAPAGRDANALALLLAAVSLVLLAAGALAWRSRTLRRRRSA